MPFDGNGNWTSNFSAVADRDANIKIFASRFDNILLADIAQSFENCLTKDMQVKPQTNFNANNYRIINVANPTANNDAVNLATLNTKDGTAVHKSGTETITSSKTFMATQYIGNSSITKGTAPASATYYGLYFVDKNGTNWANNQLGQLQMQCSANGDNVLNLTAIQQTAGSTNSAGIKVAIKQNGDAYTSAPTPTDTTSTSSSQIATVGWVNSTGNNVAHLSGTETFSGNKTFLGSVSLGALATATAPTDTTSTSSTKVATTGWVNSIGNNVAHISGDETITGAKTFISSLNRKGYWTAGTTPSSNQTTAYNFTDSTGTVYGSVNKYYSTSGLFQTRLSAKKTDGTGEIHLTIGYDENGNARALAPTPDTTTYTTSTQIATTGWVNSVGNNVAHLSGTETISGDKTFTGSNTFSDTVNASWNITQGTAPDSTSYRTVLNVLDVNGKSVARFQPAYYTNGIMRSSIQAIRPMAGSTAAASLGVFYSSDGSSWAEAPTPSSATDDSQKIATTAWIKKYITTSGAFSTFTKAAKGGFGLANGLIVNWGRSTGSTKSVTFEVPFSENTSFAIATTLAGNRQLGTYKGAVSSVTTTGFTMARDDSDTIHWLAIGY